MAILTRYLRYAPFGLFIAGALISVWLVTESSPGAFSRTSAYWNGGIALAITLLLSLLLYVTNRTGVSAQRLADEITAQLRDSEMRHRTLMNLLPMGIFVTDAKGACIHVNPKWQEMTGAIEDASLGNAWHNFIHPDDRPGIVRRWQQAVDSGREFKTDFRIGTPEGSIWVAAIARPAFSNGGMDGYIGVIADIQDRKRDEADLLTSRDRFQNLFDNANDAILLLAKDGTIADCNRTAVQMAGRLDKFRLLENPAAQFFPANDEKYELSELLKHAENAQAHHQEWSYVGKDGKIVPCDLSIRSVNLDLKKLYLVTLHDLRHRKEIENKFHITTQRFELAIKGSNDGLWDWDLTSNAVYFSPRWKEQLGYADHELANEYGTWQDRLHPDDLAMVKAMLDDHLAGKTEVYACEHRLRHRDGEWRWFLGRGKCAFDAAGKPLRMTGFNTDITESKAAIEKQKKDRQLLIDAIESIDSGFVINDEQDRLVLANTTFARIFNLPRHLLAPGTPYLDIIRYKATEGIELNPGQSPEDWAKARYDQHQRQTKLEEEYKFNGRWIRVFDRRTFNDYTVTLHQDVTAYQEQSAQLSAAKEVADRANQAKSDFLATISHEIRTPMSGIIGITDLLLAAQLPPEQRNYVATLKHSAQSLLTIINDVLDYSKLEAKKLKIEYLPLRVDAMLDRVIDLLQPAIANARLYLKKDIAADCPPEIIGDATRVQQILFNLVGNAIKFTESGGITIKISYKPRSGQHAARLRFNIIDTGIGIDAEGQSLLFKRFSQSDQTIQRRYGGTGLGLSISKQLVELMGGEIGFSSTPGQGSDFWFELPIALPAALGTGLDPLRIVDTVQLAAAPASNNSLRILVAEDNKVNQMVITAMLKKIGYTVDIANNGREAVEMLQRKTYDLILMDIQMPEMDGVEATKAIRALTNTEFSRVPILAITANAMAGDAEQYISAGMNGYVSKPINLDSLTTAIRDIEAGSGQA